MAQRTRLPPRSTRPSLTTSPTESVVHFCWFGVLAAMHLQELSHGCVRSLRGSNQGKVNRLIHTYLQRNQVLGLN